MKTILQDLSTRLPYLSPECDILSIKTENIICTSGGGMGAPGNPGLGFEKDDNIFDFGAF